MISVNGDMGELFCPACDMPHEFDLGLWDGNKSKPTLSEEVRIPAKKLDKMTGKQIVDTKKHGCHFKINNGTIQFCGESTHGMSGQTAPMRSCQ